MKLECVRQTVSTAATAMALALTAFAVVTRADVIEQVLVKVNGEIFTKTDLEARQVQALRQTLGQQVDLRKSPTDAQLRKALEEVTPQIVVDVVDEILVMQRGRELGYKLSDEQFTSVVENIKKENNIQNDEQLQAALKQEGMTMADLRKNVERSVIMQRVQQTEVTGRIAVSEAEMQAFYKTHIGDFTTPESVTLREVFVQLPDGTEAGTPADLAAKKKADDIHERIVAGESLEKLAAEQSDAPSRANAGLIGPLSLTDLSPELRKMLQTIKVGEISPVLRIARGYQILKLESFTPAQVVPFEQAREQVSERLYAQKRGAELLKFLDKLRGEAIIDFKNAEIKKAYDAGLVQAKNRAAGG
jgi:parvulin-like peptidyl-prolyl isomerase